jgi:Fe-S-cluster containining protein
MSQNEDIVHEIGLLYAWLDEILASHEAEAGDCTACGQCCNFDAFGHRLYVTHAEILYFSKKMGGNLKEMPSGRCPYMDKNRCSVHKHRFLGCRIYGCQGDSDFQNQLTEQALGRLKALCDKLDIPYKYMDLRQALNQQIEPSYPDKSPRN